MKAEIAAKLNVHATITLEGKDYLEMIVVCLSLMLQFDKYQQAMPGCVSLKQHPLSKPRN